MKTNVTIINPSIMFWQPTFCQLVGSNERGTREHGNDKTEVPSINGGSSS